MEPSVLAYSDQADALLSNVMRLYQMGASGGETFDRISALPVELVTTALLFAARRLVDGEGA